MVEGYNYKGYKIIYKPDKKITEVVVNGIVLKSLEVKDKRQGNRKAKKFIDSRPKDILNIFNN